MIKKVVFLMSISMVVNGIYAEEPCDSIKNNDIEGLKKYINEERKKGTLQDSINKVGKDKQTPLYWAVKMNNFAMVKLLLENDAKNSINTADKFNSTPIWLAVTNNNLKMVKLLLENGAKDSINEVDRSGLTPLYFAVFVGNLEMVELLLYFGAKVTKEILNILDNKDKAIIDLIKNPGLIHARLSKQKEEEFAKISGNIKQIDEKFGTGMKVEKTQDYDNRTIIKFN